MNTQTAKENLTEPRLNFFAFGPGAMLALATLDQRVARSDLERPLVELVRIRVSQLNGCAYCLDRHMTDARKLGEAERRLSTLQVWRDTPFFSERERAALEWAEALTLIAGNTVTDDLWQRVKLEFPPAQLVDLTLAVSAVNSWNRFAIAFRKLPA
ncbi:carboxymuconolactone decarboxylase family protein [Dyella sp.]|uniref:carboxymuconolactone decarboxylase family protein n=1 Tax=Dyella sp. TaxID=1869338 RepID=UPI003F7EC850